MLKLKPNHPCRPSAAPNQPPASEESEASVYEHTHLLLAGQTHTTFMLELELELELLRVL